jgi:hypothetical protein
MTKRNDEADLYFATVCGNDGKPEWDFLFGCIDAALRFPGLSGTDGLAPNPVFGLYVEENRDIATAKFLASGCRHLLMVDTDTGFRADDIQALLDCGKDVVSGTYHYKDGSGVAVGTGTGEKDGDLERCEVVPAGFLLITRQTMLRLMAAMPEDVYMVQDIGLVPAIWTGRYKPGVACQRDDAAFSKHCCDAGIELWRHTGVILRHHGAAAY